MVAAGAMALGLWFSADASRLLIGSQTTAVALQPAVPAAPMEVAALPLLPDPFPEHTEEPAEEPSAPAATTPKGSTPAAAAAPPAEPRPVAKSKRKVARAHRKGTYASRRRGNDPRVAYTDPRQARPQTYYGYGYGYGQSTFSGPGRFGGQSNWSFYR